MTPKINRWWKGGLIVLTALSIPTFIQVVSLSQHHPEYLESARIKVLLACLLVMFLASHAFTWIKIFRQFIAKTIEKLNRHRWLGYAIMAITLTAYFLFVFVQGKRVLILSGFWPWLTFSFITVFLCGWVAHFLSGREVWETFSLTALCIGVCQQLIFYYPYPLAYPFTISWSETSWFYYASFFFSKRLYNTQLPWPFLDIGKPLLLSLAYLIPNTPIWLLRLWQYVLWIGSAFLVAMLLKRRLHPSSNFSPILILWAFSWILLGPVYYHLSLSVAMILLGFDRDRFWKTVFWVGLASLWTGILRINWLPMPSIMAISLYLIETPMLEKENHFRYLKRPFFYAIFGLSLGFASFFGYLAVSGKFDTRIGTKFSSPFLLDRLWPNATLATGIVPGVVLISLGLVIIIFLSWRTLRYNFLRWILLLTMLLLLLGGGIIASIRIGGGNNLHNLDAYLVLLMVWGGYALAGKIQTEKVKVDFQARPILILLVCLTPVIWGSQFLSIITPKDMGVAYQELDSLNQLVQSETQKNEKPALFVYQRHLITFGKIDTPLVTEYELEELSEMANSGNTEYFEHFYTDLEDHKYSLIIMDNSRSDLKPPTDPFAEENNAWVTYVMKPLTQYYQPVLLLPQSGIRVYAPIP